MGVFFIMDGQTGNIICIIIVFMILAGFSIAKSIQSGSLLGLILSLVSLSLEIYFIHLLTQAKEQEETV